MTVCSKPWIVVCSARFKFALMTKGVSFADI